MTPWEKGENDRKRRSNWRTHRLEDDYERAVGLAERIVMAAGRCSVARVRFRGQTLWMGDWHGNSDESVYAQGHR